MESLDPNTSFSKLSPLVKNNWRNKWGRYTQRHNFSKLSPLAKIVGIIIGVVTPKDTTKIAEPPCQTFDANNEFGQHQFRFLSPG